MQVRSSKVPYWLPQQSSTDAWLTTVLPGYAVLIPDGNGCFGFNSISPPILKQGLSRSKNHNYTLSIKFHKFGFIGHIFYSTPICDD